VSPVPNASSAAYHASKSGDPLRWVEAGGIPSRSVIGGVRELLPAGVRGGSGAAQAKCASILAMTALDSARTRSLCHHQKR